jgi:hypothetical protein
MFTGTRGACAGSTNQSHPKGELDSVLAKHCLAPGLSRNSLRNMRVLPLSRQSVNNPRDTVSRHGDALPCPISCQFTFLGMSVSAEGLWAIAATIIIVLVVAVIATRRA